MQHKLLKFEARNEPLAARSLFLGRLATCALLAAAIVVVSVLAGMLGYRYFASLGWMDAYLNATMVTSGMGQVSTVKTMAGQIFAGFFAIYSSVLVAVAIGITLAPMVHRFLHRFHIDDKNA